jgi:phospholipid/cholesterol/gamma-HCH transport system substrate-binding protein
MPKNTEIKVGFFVVATILLVVLFIGYVAYKKDYFSNVYTFTLSSKSGEGFSEGMPVVFSGFEIGKVYDLELNEQGIVIITIKVPERHVRWLHSDSIFILDRPIIGSPKITVYTGNLQSPVLSTDTTPEVFPVDSIDDAIQRVQPLIEKAGAVADNIARITATLSEKESLLEMAVGDKKSVASVNDTLQKLTSMGDRAEGILKNLERITAKLDGMAGKTDERLFGGEEGILPLVSSILKDILEKLKTLDAAVEDLPKLTGDVVRSTDNLELLRRDIDRAVDSVNEVLKGVERLIPVKKEKEIGLP